MSKEHKEQKPEFAFLLEWEDNYKYVSDQHLRLKTHLQEKGLVGEEMPLCKRKKGDDFSLLSDSKPSPYFEHEGCENIIDLLLETKIWFVPSGGNAYTLSSASLQEHIGMSYDVETNEMVFALLFSTYYISLLRFDPNPMDKEFIGATGFVRILQRRMAYTLNGSISIGNFPIDVDFPNLHHLATISPDGKMYSY